MLLNNLQIMSEDHPPVLLLTAHIMLAELRPEELEAAVVRWKIEEKEKERKDK
jgi:hypothetical protein